MLLWSFLSTDIVLIHFSLSSTVDFVTVIHKQQQQQQQQQQDQYLRMMFANVCKQLMDKSSN